MLHVAAAYKAAGACLHLYLSCSPFVSSVPTVDATLARFPLLRLVSTDGSAIGIRSNSLRIYITEFICYYFLVFSTLSANFFNFSSVFLGFNHYSSKLNRSFQFSWLDCHSTGFLYFLLLDGARARGALCMLVVLQVPGCLFLASGSIILNRWVDVKVRDFLFSF